MKEKKESKFSYYNKPISNTKPTRNEDIESIINIIKGNKFKEVCKRIKQCKTKKEKDIIKTKELDYVCFAGTFKKREEKSLINLSGLMCIDIDNLKPEEAIDKKEFLKNNDFVNAIFISPSGQGLKIIVKIPLDLNNHKKYMDAFCEMTGAKYDIGTHDISRACFISHDPEAYINNDSDIWEEKGEGNKAKEQTTIPKKENDISRSGKEWREICKLIRKGIKKKDLDKTYIFNEMNFFSKWKDSPAAYKEITWTKALKESTRIKEEKRIDTQAFSLFTENKDQLAEKFYKIQPFFYDPKKNLFWLWNNKKYCYEMLEETELLYKLKETSGEEHFQTSRGSFWTETIRALKIIGIGHIPKEINKNWIQFKNQIVNYKTGERFPATPEYFNVNPIPHNIGEEKETPTIDKIFLEWVEEKYVKTLKEVISVCMIQDYRLHRIIILTGSGLNGKGVYQNLLRKIIGEKNICSSELDLLIENRFETAKLYKKLVCSMGETNFNILKNTSRIKRLTGQDLVGFEFKNKNCFDEFNYAKLIINTNSLPPTTDKTTGFYRRICLIDFPNQFSEGIDVINRIPEKEFNNFCLQSLDHIKDVFDNGGFTNEGDIEERKKRYEEKSNPLPNFIKENYGLDVNGRVPYFKFYDDYIGYLKARGSRILSKPELSKLLRNEGYETKDQNVKKNDGKYTVWRFILGISSLDNVDNVDNEVIPLKQNSTRESENTPLSTLSTLFKFKRLDNKLYAECELCKDTEESLEWEDDRGRLLCNTCKLGLELNP